VIGCELFGGELSAYRDDELAPAARGALESHLPGCASCRSALDRLAWLDARLGELPAAAPSPDFEARFRARLARASEPAGWRARLEHVTAALRPAWSLPALAAAVAAVAALLYLRDPRTGRGPEIDPDWAIAADVEGFELVLAEDPELLAALDLLEGWDGLEES
jgi:anti-sigma factor RsiW